MIEEVKSLWKLCFDDSDEFIELYFAQKYKDEYNMSIYDGGRMISALQMLPYPMTFCNELIATSYISGACTHPDFRDKGAMKQLLAKTFVRMYDDGVLLSTLIPAEEWLFGYYSKFGYSYAFDYSVEKIDTTAFSGSDKYRIIEYTAYQMDAHTYLERKMMERTCCIQHPMEDFEAIYADLKLSQGELLIARLNTEIVGMVFYVPTGSVVEIKDLFAESQEIKETLLKEVSSRTKISLLNYTAPPASTEGFQLGMARIINAKKMLDLYVSKYTQVNFLVELSDDFIAENEGYYALKNGICEKRYTPEYKSYHKLTICQLTQLLLGYQVNSLPDSLQVFEAQKPYMSLMLN